MTPSFLDKTFVINIVLILMLYYQALVNCHNFNKNPQEKDIHDSTSVIVFFGTPHQGFSTRELQKLVDRFDQGAAQKIRSTSILQNLDERSPYLNELRSQLRQRLVNRKIFTIIETQTTATNEMVRTQPLLMNQHLVTPASLE